MSDLTAVALRPGNIVAWVVVGLIAGAIAGRIAHGRGYGCLGDVILGLLGAFVGGLVVSPFINGDQTAGFLGTTAIAIVGAVVLILGVRVVRRIL